MAWVFTLIQDHRAHHCKTIPKNEHSKACRARPQAFRRRTLCPRPGVDTTQSRSLAKHNTTFSTFRLVPSTKISTARILFTIHNGYVRPTFR